MKQFLRLWGSYGLKRTRAIHLVEYLSHPFDTGAKSEIYSHLARWIRTVIKVHYRYISGTYAIRITWIKDGWQQSVRRRNTEESCVCTHAKVPARSGLGLALGLVVAFVVIANQGIAQESFSVSGKVISAASGVAVEGATVTNKRTRIHTVTDRTGEYRIQARPDDMLIYSFVGYRTTEEEINGRQQIIVAMDSAENILEEVEVVSTGYQTIPKERATGSFVFVDSALLNRAVSTDIISRLKGVAPSLLFDERAGGEPKLSIRGRSTIYANADPLIVVDNFPYEGDIRNINPNDVESVSILRDAAAASIWGVRAGNGVIVITTKRGRPNQPLRINLSSSATVGDKPNLFYEQRIQPLDMIEIEQFLFGKGYYDRDLVNTSTYPEIPPAVEIMADSTLTDGEKQRQLGVLGTHDTRDALDRFFYQHEVKQQFALNIQGGGTRHHFYYSAGFDKAKEKEVGNDFDKLSLNARHTFSLAPRLELGTGFSYTQSREHINTVYRTLHNTYPYLSIADRGNPLPIPHGYRMGFVQRAEEKGLLNWLFVPLDELALADRSFFLNSTRITGSLSYKFISGLIGDIRYQHERQVGDTRDLDAEDSYAARNMINSFSVIGSTGITRNLPMGAILSHYHSGLRSQNGRAQLSYSKQWPHHGIYAIGGFELREVRGHRHSATYYGYDVLTGTGSVYNPDSLYQQYPGGNRSRIAMPTGTNATVDRFRSVFFNSVYTYLGRYTLSASGRVDQSNLFGVRTNQKSVPLWSAGVKWDIHNEPFLVLPALSLLQLRATYGYNGNFDNTVTAYTTARFNTFNNLLMATITNPPNPNLRWEKNAVLNLGLDFAFGNQVLSGKIEYYRRKGKDLIGDGTLDPTTGMTTFRGNLADMTGHGWDVEINSRIIRNRPVGWSSQLLFGYTVDKVTRYEEQLLPPTSYLGESLLDGIIPPREGQPLFGMYSYPWAGLDPANGGPRGYLNGEPSTDIAAITGSLAFSDMVYHGRGVPPIYGAFRNTVTYKQLALSINVSYKMGYYFRNTSIQYDQLFRGISNHSDYTLRWREPGDETHTNVPAMTYPASASADAYYANSAALIERGDHIRIQDIRISYDFNLGSTRRFPLRECQVYGYVSNVGILWRSNGRGIDPDYSVQRRVGNGGVMVLPAPRRFALGVSLNL